MCLYMCVYEQRHTETGGLESVLCCLGSRDQTQVVSLVSDQFCPPSHLNVFNDNLYQGKEKFIIA